jgi:predicted nucleic acid-binding protein
VLIDTNVLSELARARPDPAVARWVGTLQVLHISVVTLDEVFFGLTTKRNARVQRWFEMFLGTHCHVLDITAPIARHAGILRGQHPLHGRAHSQADMLIAATAALHGLSLATRNVRDFGDCGIAVVNPFDWVERRTTS